MGGLLGHLRPNSAWGWSILLVLGSKSGAGAVRRLDSKPRIPLSCRYLWNQTLTIIARPSLALAALLLLTTLGACAQDVSTAPSAAEVSEGNDPLEHETEGHEPASTVPETPVSELAVVDTAASGTGREARSGAFDFSPGGPITDAQLGEYHVLMRATIDGEDLGEMAFTFWPEKAPISVRNFLRLVDQGFYDGLTYHRVVRDFMVQGGCVDGTGMGQSPLGMIKGEFSDDAEWNHTYGVLSMARSPSPDTAGSQFFIINDDGPNPWSLDGKYASFGRMTQGVATLEALSDVKVSQAPNGELSKPNRSLVMESVRVVHGPAPSGESIERPGARLDLGGAPERVQIHSMLIGYQSRYSRATRSPEEAAILAADLQRRIEAGEDFDALSTEYSDDPVQVTAEKGLGHIGFHILNSGVRDRAGERFVYDLQRNGQEQMKSMNAAHQRGEIKTEELRAQSQGLQRMFKEQLRLNMGFQSEMLGPQALLGEIALKMELGEVKLVPYDISSCRDGWYLLHRVK